MSVSRRAFVKAGAVAAGTLVAGGGAVKAATWAREPEIVRQKIDGGPRKVLVTYATKSGSVSGVAAKIGEALAAAGATVETKPISDRPDASAYDAVVVGSGIRMGAWHDPAKKWVASNATELKRRPVAFFTVCLTMADGPGKAPDVRAYTDSLVKESGVKPLDVGTFAGWFVPSKFSFLERTILGAMKAREGDHRDPAAVTSWAKGVSSRLGVRA